MEKKCEVCGRVYKRETCPYCKRLERFIRLGQYKVLNKLPKRLRDDVKQLKQPPMDSIHNYYLYGSVSTGKTVFAGQVFFDRHKESYMDNVPFAAEFVVVPELLLKLRASFQDNMEKHLIDYYSQLDLLILDDLGVDKCSDWVKQTLYLILNRRYENKLQTIITSNLSLNMLAKWFGDERLSRRIQQTYKIRKHTKVYQ